MTTAFTKRFVDKSLPVGYRFQFYCDRSSNLSIDLSEPTLVKTHKNCTYSYLTTFQPSATGALARVFQAANILISSAKKDSLAAASEALNLTRDKFWDDAFDRAVVEAKPYFENCKRCNRWVCAQNCWDVETKQCVGCLTGSPTSELTLTKAHQFFSKVWENVQSAMEVGIDGKVNICHHCGEKAGTGKFCGMCGGPIDKQQLLVFCAHCGEQLQNDPSLKFCPNCGDSLDYLQR